VTGWTFESLATADRDQLEELVSAGTRPDYGLLEGRLYRGVNLGFKGRLAGEKFKKGFARRDERTLGYNELCRQDRKAPRGEWLVKPKRSPVGHFRVGVVAEEPRRKPYDGYPGAGLFDYNLGLNTGRYLVFRLIRDVVVLPNPGDHDLVLGKAYLDAGIARVFWCYFVLGGPVPIEAPKLMEAR
jgi:hypothetical protein